MTTNVYDVRGGLLTSDSRWSSVDGEWLVFVDDTGFDKIIADQQLSFLFAGNMLNIAAWKSWVSAGRLTPAPTHMLNETSIIIVDNATGAVVFYTDYLLHSEADGVRHAWYGGTGAPHAKDCWEVNKCAKKAVESAILVDRRSGGTVVHLNRQTLETNVTNAESHLSVAVQLKERGIMKNSNGKEFKLSEVVSAPDAANDASTKTEIDGVAKRLAERVMNGSVALSAPFPGIDQPWTNEKKLELTKVLERYAPKR
jgi:hypothetical protein